jgi:hypothetical protein
LTKGINQYSYTDYANGNGKKVDLSNQVLASGTRVDRVLTVSKSKHQSSSTFGSRGVASSYDFSGFKASSFVVSVMNVSTNDSAGRWSSPRRELLLSRNNSESVLGNKVFSFEPTNVNGLEGIMDFDSLTVVNDLGMNHDNPDDCTDCGSVYSCDETIVDIANRKVRNSGENANYSDHYQVDPVASSSVNVIVSHDGQTIAESIRVSSFSATKEGN